MIRQYRLKNVYGRLSEAARKALIDFWIGLKVLTPEEAEERSYQAAFLLLDKHDEIVGVNTVYIDNLLFPANPYYFYRTLIHPEHRHSYNILIEMFNRTFILLEKKERKTKQAKGLALTIENPKLAKTLSLARFRESGETHIVERLGILYAGKDRFGHDLWYRNFPKV